jgi:hypothetical protein
VDLEEEVDFTKFVCFISTLQFKILKITADNCVSQIDKIQASHFTLNIIFQCLEYVNPNYWWYPLRAMSEYLLSDGQTSHLSNRLDADNLLNYKLKKEIQSNEFISQELNKAQRKAQDTEGLLQ